MHSQSPSHQHDGLQHNLINTVDQAALNFCVEEVSASRRCDMAVYLSTSVSRRDMSQPLHEYDKYTSTHVCGKMCGNAIFPSTL